MNKNIIDSVFGWLSIGIGFAIIIIVAPHVNEFFIQKECAYFTRQLLTMAGSFVIGIIAGVIFYLLYLLAVKIVKRIKSKK